MSAVLQTNASPTGMVPAGVDLVEYYYERGFTDGLPVVPPTRQKIDEIVERLGGDAGFVEARVAPRWGELTREVLAINMVMAGCKPEYAPVVLAGVKAITDQASISTACKRPRTWPRPCWWSTGRSPGRSA